ncbi:MAG: hypothetical protein AAF194_02165 [Pseudomonadota bacterium]
MSRSTLRALVAGPLAILTAVLAMAATPLVTPASEGGVDHFIFPILLFPGYLAGACLYAVIDDKLARAAAVLLAICTTSLVLIFATVTV